MLCDEDWFVLRRELFNGGARIVYRIVQPECLNGHQYLFPLMIHRGRTPPAPAPRLESWRLTVGIWILVKSGVAESAWVMWARVCLCLDAVAAVWRL